MGATGIYESKGPDALDGYPQHFRREIENSRWLELRRKTLTKDLSLEPRRSSGYATLCTTTSAILIKAAVSITPATICPNMTAKWFDSNARFPLESPPQSLQGHRTDMLFLCHRLLSESGEASQTTIAQQIIDAYRYIQPEDRPKFFELLSHEFSSDTLP